jgi:TatD DNase family protein
MVDSHCHIDLFPSPHKIAQDCERLGIRTICMTNLPSHFELGYPFLRSFKKVRIALGMHPLKASEHQKEMNGFKQCVSRTSYIGEIGLDYSREGFSTKEIQLHTFRSILDIIGNGNKIVSLHSRRAEKEVLEQLVEFKIANAIFHWYSGSLGLIADIVANGYYFSVNSAMIKSQAGQKIIAAIPRERVLTETDGPFIQHNGRPLEPKDIGQVLQYLSTIWSMDVTEAEKLVDSNFSKLVDKIR